MRMCFVEACMRRHLARGMCALHYDRWYRTGDPLTIAQPRGDAWARLMRRVVKQPSGCWEWQGARQRMGHGVIGRGRRGEGTVLVHRLSWEVHNGPVPVGMCVCHHCDNPPCVNPDHLFVGTRNDNNQDMMRKGRHASQRKAAAA